LVFFFAQPEMTRVKKNMEKLIDSLLKKITCFIMDL